MIHKLLLFLELINASSARLDHAKQKELKVYVDNKQLDIINEEMKNNSVIREVMTRYLQSMVVDEISGGYILTIRFS